ncbi:MAG: hypothetical protein ACREGF_00050, partial [Candidatus Saccharimonadales bacterium]
RVGREMTFELARKTFSTEGRLALSGWRTFADQAKITLDIGESLAERTRTSEPYSRVSQAAEDLRRGQAENDPELITFANHGIAAALVKAAHKDLPALQNKLRQVAKDHLCGVAKNIEKGHQLGETERENYTKLLDKIISKQPISSLGISKNLLFVLERESPQYSKDRSQD